MKKFRLFLSICVMCLTLAILCFGVFAATSVTYTISGTVSYQIVDVFAKINAYVFKVTDQTSSADMKKNIDTLATMLPENIQNSATASNSNLSYVFDQKLDEFDTTVDLEKTNVSQELDITLGQGANLEDIGYYTYYIVINIENLADRAVNAMLSDKTKYTNLISSSNYIQNNITKDASKNLVVAFSIKDKTQSIEEAEINYSIEVSYTEYVLPVLYNSSGNRYNNLARRIAGSIKNLQSWESGEILNSITFVSSLDGVDTTTNSPINVGYDGTTTPDDSCVAYWAQDATDTSKYNVWIYSKIGRFILPENSSYMFYGCNGLTSLDLSPLDTTRVTNMTCMFTGCSGLTSLDLTPLETTNVTNMSGMFSSCSGLTSLDLTPLETTNVTNMSSMFSSCRGLTSLDLTPLDTTRVTNMSYMFSGCSGLTSLDLTPLNTSKVTNMMEMFSNCKSLTTLNLTPLDTTNVESMYQMFYYCESLTSLDLTPLNTSNVTSMRSMFFYCRSLTSLDLSNFNTSKVADMREMFGYCFGLTDLNIGSFDLGTVDSYAYIFQECNSLATIFCPTNIGDLSISLPERYKGWMWTDQGGNEEFEVTTLKQGGKLEIVPTLFNNNDGFSSYIAEQITGDSSYLRASKLKSINFVTDLAGVDTTTNTPINVGYRRSITNDYIAYWLEDDDETNKCNVWIYSKIGKFILPEKSDKLFANCSGLKTLDLSNFVIYTDTSMSSMFSGCSGLTSLDLTPLDTSKVTNMSYMFSGCSGLTNLDLSNFDTSSVTNMSGMFSRCMVSTLDLRSFNFSKVTSYSGMLSSCLARKIYCPTDINSLSLSLPSDNWIRTWTDADGVNKGAVTTLPQNGIVTAIPTLYNGIDAMNGDLMSHIAGVITNVNWCNTGVIKSVNFVTSLDGVDITTNSPIKVCYSSGVYIDEYVAYWLADADESKKYNVWIYSKNGKFVLPADSSNMFYYCSGLTSLDLTPLDTINVTNMGSMFYYCKSLTSLDLTPLDTSNVTNMSSMFYLCSGLTTLDLSCFKETNVTDVTYMFAYCTNLVSVNLNGFDTAKVEKMGNYWESDGRYFYRCGMFTGCSKLVSVDLSCLDTSNVKNIGALFASCTNLKSITFGSNFAPNATNMERMFENCSSLTTLDLTPLNTSNVTNVKYMFSGCSSLTTLDLTPLNTINVTNMGGMFYGCSVLTTLDLTPLNTTNVTNMSSMFSGCSSLTTLDLTPLNTTSVTNMSSMFSGCSSLTTLDLTPLNTSNVTNMYAMFSGCSASTSINLSEFNTSKVTNMQAMFKGCSSLTALNLSSFDTSNVTTMGYYYSWSSSESSSGMFEGCSSLVSLDLSNFDTSKVTNISSMFRGCSSLTELNIKNFDLSKITGTNKSYTGYDVNMLSSCTALATIYCPININSRSIFLPSGTWTWVDASGVSQGTVTKLQQGGTLTKTA